MGPNSNVESISFKFDAMSPTNVTFDLDGSESDVIEASDRTPPLAARIPEARRSIFLDLPDGLTDRGVRRTRAQGAVNKSFDNVVAATGTLDALRFGRILKPRRLVDVRGAGDHYNGSYYVTQVTHNVDVRKGEYKQTFQLEREGVGATSPIVRT
jgi:hypothetical protein